MRETASLIDDFEYNQLIFSRYPGTLVWQNSDAKFLCASPEAMRDMGFIKFHEMFGRGPADMKNSFADLADALERNNKDIITQNSTIIAVFSAYLPDGAWGLYLGQQQPLLNSKGKITGVASQAINISQTALARQFIPLFLNQDTKTAGTKLQHGFYRYSTSYEKLNLPKRQAECFFWAIRKKNCDRNWSFARTQ